MKGHVDEAEYLKLNDNDDEYEEKDTDKKDQFIKSVKKRIFCVFLRLNTNKISIALHYYILMILVETLQLLSIILNDGKYSKIGPYETATSWNLTQTQWIIDVCWVFRFDHYFRINESSFLALLIIIAFFTVTILLVGTLLAFSKYLSHSVVKFCIKIMKLMITLVTSILLIPFLDSLAFAMSCSLKNKESCLAVPEGYQYMIAFVFFTVLFIGIISFTGMLYYDMCALCGGVTSMPHTRFKLLRYAGYIIIIFSYYFIETYGKVILFLVISLVVSLILCYAYVQYLPYYNQTILDLRLASLTTFTTAIFCMLVAEVFNSTDSSNSSVTMMFYFLTPCLIQVTRIYVAKRSKSLQEKSMQHLTNPYQIEIKARMLVYKLEEAKKKHLKMMYGEADIQESQEFKILHESILKELEDLFNEAFKKFPNAELLYLWSGLIQLHIFENYILAMIHCFRGLALANKIDSQYSLYQFRRTSESFYMSSMTDDAYQYEMFEKAFQTAQKNDETVTRSQFFFWSELESKAPRIQKLNKISEETSKLIVVTKDNYDKLIKLNSKSIQALRMYGWFLSSLNNFAELGQRYLNKAEMLEEAQEKQINSNVEDTLSQPLSYFDSDNAIFRISGDFETIGEIQKANASACQLFGYLSAEMVGRNVSLIIPSPFSETHDEYIKNFHQFGKYNVIDKQDLVLYFTNKNNNIFEARLLVKVVPCGELPPYMSVIVKPTNPKYEIIILNTELIITGCTTLCNEILEIASSKSTEQKIANVIHGFENNKDKMMSEGGFEYSCDHERFLYKMLLNLSDLVIGGHKAHILKIEILEKLEKNNQGTVIHHPEFNEIRPMFSPNLQVQDVKVNNPIISPQVNNIKDSSESSNESHSISDENGKPPSKEEIDSPSSKESEDKEESDENDEKDVCDKKEEKKKSDENEESESEESEESEEESEEHENLEETKVPLDSTRVMDKSKLTGNNIKKIKDVNSSSTASMEEHRNDKPTTSFAKHVKIDDFIAVECSDKSGSSNSENEEESGDKEESEDFSESDEDNGKKPVSEKSNDEDAEIESGDAHSSSRSVTSSMASVAQFNKSIKALISYEYNITSKFVFRFKITLILTIVVLIVTSIVTYAIIANSIADNEKLSHYVNLVGNCRHHTRSLAFYARMFHLYDNSSIVDAQTSRDDFFTWMSEDTYDMHKINLEIYTNYKVLTEGEKKFFKDEDIATYFREGSLVREIKKNVYDSISGLALQGFMLDKEFKETKIDMKNHRAFYLFRNGNGETVEYLNKSAELYVFAAQRDLESQRIIAIILITGSILLLVLCAAFAIIPSVKTLENSRREIWEIFFEIPSYVCRVMKAKCCDRLNILNEQANLDLEELNQEEVQEEEKKDENDGKSDDKELKKQNSTKKKKPVEKKTVLAYDPKQKTIMIAKLFCFFIVSVVYFYLIYYTGFEVVGNILKNEPVHLNWASRRKELTRAIDTWVTEAILENITDYGYKYAVFDKQDRGSPYQYAISLINELDYVENSLIFGNPDKELSFDDKRGSTHEELLFENGCIAPVNRSISDQCLSVGDQAMAQGLHSALGIYTTLARNILQRVSTGFIGNNLTEAQIYLQSENVALLRDLDNRYLYDALLYSSNLYEDDYKEQQKTMKIWQNVLMVLYSVFSVFLFFLVYSPMINRIGLDTKNAWSLCTLIPQEYQEDFKKLGAVIKDRRDKFKWR